MRVSLLQWNVLYTEPIELIAAAIKSFKADIICLQELTLGYQAEHPDTGKFLAGQLGLSSAFGYGPITFPDGKLGQIGCGVFAKFPILRRNSSHAPLLYTKVTLEIGSTTVDITSTHLPLRPSFRTTNNKKFLAAQLLTQTQVDNPNSILAGDFNSTPRSAVILKVKSQLKHAGPSLAQPTWTKQPFQVDGYHFATLSRRIDYVFFQGKLRFVESTLLDTPYSDHCPILATFEIDT